MNGCCIVETRPITNLAEIIIDRHLKFIPKDWGLTIYCSELNHEYIKDVDFGRPTIIHLMEDSEMDIRRYNVLMKSKSFWESLPYEKVLIFQSDSRLLRSGIEDFLQWDYIGAPWVFQEHGGNGGLSLRSVKAMKDIIKVAKFTGRNEDVEFCNLMLMHQIGKLAPRTECFKFSCETIAIFGSLGTHAIHKWLSKAQCKQILNQYD